MLQLSTSVHIGQSIPVPEMGEVTWISKDLIARVLHQEERDEFNKFASFLHTSILQTIHLTYAWNPSQ